MANKNNISENLEKLQELWEGVGNPIKERARNIYGCGVHRFRDIVNGKTTNGGKVSEDCIQQALQATKQAIKDEAAAMVEKAANL